MIPYPASQDYRMHIHRLLYATYEPIQRRVSLGLDRQVFGG